MKKWFSLLLYFLLAIETEEAELDRVVGFFSLCKNNSIGNNNSNTTQSSLQLNASIAYTITHRIFKNGNSNKLLYNYTAYDVCNSSDDLTRVIIDLLLGNGEDILFVLAHVSSDLLQQLYSIMKVTTVWIIDFNLETIYEYNSMRSDVLLFHMATDGSQKRPYLDSKVMLKWHWYNIAILCIRHELNKYDFYYRMLTGFIENMRSSNRCYSVKFIDMNSPVESYVSFLNNSKAIVLYGSTESQLKVLKKLQNHSQSLVNGKFWLTHDLRGKTVGADIYIKSRTWYPHGLSPKFFNLVGENEYTIHITRILTTIKLYSTKYYGLARSYSYYIHLLKRYVNDFKIFMGPEKYHQGTTCKFIECPAGEEITFGKFFDKDEIFFGEKCLPCKINHYRNSSSARCAKCPLLTISSTDRTTCIDPYIPLFITTDILFAKIAIISTCLSFLCVIIIATSFVYFRATPVVRGTDLKMTSLHLLSHTLLHVILMFSYLSMPSTTLCYLQPLTISFFHVTNVSITLAKSEKVLKAFRGTTRVRHNGVRKLEALQGFGIILFVLIGNLLLLSSIVSSPPKVIEKLSAFTDSLAKEGEELSVENENFEKLMSCNNLNEVNKLIAYVTLLQLFSLVQAFRSRHLPSTYKSCMSVVYGNFINNVLSLIYIPIFVFQKEELEKQSLQWLLVSLNNLVALAFDYGHKIYVVLFLPHLNDREYVRDERLRKIKNSIESRL